MVSDAGFSQVDEHAAGLALQRVRQTQQRERAMQGIAHLLCSRSSLQQSYTDGSLWEAASKPFAPLPLAALQPKIKVKGYCAVPALGISLQLVSALSSWAHQVGLSLWRTVSADSFSGKEPCLSQVVMPTCMQLWCRQLLWEELCLRQVVKFTCMQLCSACVKPSVGLACAHHMH